MINWCCNPYNFCTSDDKAQRMPSTCRRFNRMLSLRTAVILGVITLVFTFIMLIFSGDLHHYDRQDLHIKKGSQDRPHSQQLDQKLMVQEDNGEAIQYHKDRRPPMSVARIAKYCNPPNSLSVGEEGLVPSDYKLLNVHVVIRHGDRSPIGRLQGGKSGDLSCLFDVSNYGHLPKVTNFALIMAGASKELPKDNPFKRWAMYPSHPVCADGQLTGRGAVQQILNGMHCSERYYHQHKLFDEETWPLKVVAHSTEISRTYQSGIAFLYGLLPAFDAEKLSINRASNINFCEESIVGGSCSCNSVESLRSKAVRECRADEGYTELLKKMSRLSSHLSDVLGMSPKNIQWTSMMDGLSSFACHNTAPFCNSNGSCITAKTVEDVWKLVDHQSMCLHNNPHYKRFSKAASFGLLYRISQEMKTAVNLGSNPTFHLYSGHDTTVSPLITALELNDAVWPGYATRIIFELYQKESSKENFIRILQNGKVVTPEVVFCQGVTTEGFCGFDRLLDYVTSEKSQSTCLAIKPEENWVSTLSSPR